jgi:hypothetical protein
MEEGVVENKKMNIWSLLGREAQRMGYLRTPDIVRKILLLDHADDLTVEQIAGLMRAGEKDKKKEKKVVRKRERPSGVVVSAKPTKKHKIVIDLTGDDDDAEEAEFVVLGDDDAYVAEEFGPTEKELHELLEECLQDFDDAYVDSVVPKEDFVVFDNDFHCQEFALNAVF